MLLSSLLLLLLHPIAATLHSLLTIVPDVPASPTFPLCTFSPLTLTASLIDAPPDTPEPPVLLTFPNELTSPLHPLPPPVKVSLLRERPRHKTTVSLVKTQLSLTL